MADSTIKIGQILIEQGVLSEQQVFEVLREQRDRGVPFGVLAERMFDVTPESIEQAWIEQYHRFTDGEIDLSEQRIDERTLALINRRQAWQFEMMPLHYNPDGELLIAASRRRLARAVAFVAARVEPIAFFRIAHSDQLRTFLQEHYPMPEVTEELMRQAHDMAWDDRKAG